MGMRRIDIRDILRRRPTTPELFYTVDGGTIKQTPTEGIIKFIDGCELLLEHITPSNLILQAYRNTKNEYLIILINPDNEQIAFVRSSESNLDLVIRSLELLPLPYGESKARDFFIEELKRVMRKQ